MASNTFCEPCNRKHTASTAVSWCSDCEEALCKDCVDAHQVIKVSSTHHVIDVEHALLIPGATLTTQQFCADHSDLILDLFCTFHDSLCCRACMTEFHRNCDKIIPIDLAAKDIKDSTLLFDLSEELGNLITSSNQISDNRQKHIDNIEQDEQKLKQQIGKAKADVISYVDKLERELLADLQKLRVAAQGVLQTERDAMLNMTNAAKDLQQQISYTVNNGSTKQMFLLLHKVKSSIANMDQQLEKNIGTMTTPILQFKESNNKFKFTEQLGNIGIRKDSCSVMYKSPKLRFAQVLPPSSDKVITYEFENKFEIDISPPLQITGMVASQDGKLLLCNYRNNNILAYNSSGTFISSCSLFGAPWDITISQSETDLAIVTTPQSSSIRFMQIAQLKAGKAIELPGNCYGIVAGKDKIFVGGIQEMYILDGYGTHLSTVTVAKTTRMWYMDVLNDNIYYSDQNNLFCVDVNGQEIFTYNSPRLTRPMAITVDNNDMVYVSGCNSNNIHRLTANGTYVDTVLCKSDQISHPWAMCFDRYSRKLAFSNNDGKTICVFKCTN